MSEYSPQSMTVTVGIVTNGIRPLWKVPDSFGGITIIEASITFQEAGTAGLYLIDAGTAGTGTGALGTLATYGGTAYTALTPSDMTIATDSYLDAGKWLAVKEDNTGTTLGTTTLTFSYRYGK